MAGGRFGGLAVEEGHETMEGCEMGNYFQAEWIVGLWLLPTLLFIVLPLTILVVWGIVQFFRKAEEKSRAMQELQRQRAEEAARLAMEPSTVNRS